MNIIIGELLTLYNAYKKGGENPLSPLKIQYKDYSEWQRQQLIGDELIGHQQYWRTQFEGELTVLDLPADYARPLIKTLNGDRITFLLDTHKKDALYEMSKKYGASLFMTLTASVTAILYRYTHQEDIIIGTPVAGRDHVNLEDQIGLYLNTLALRMQFCGNESFVSLLENVKKTILDGYDHQIYPFDKLVNDLVLTRDTSRDALFDVMVILQNTDNEGEIPSIDGLKIYGYNQEVNTSKFDLTFGFKETAQGLLVQIEYNTDIFSNKRIERLKQHYQEMVTAILANDQIPLNLIQYLSLDEKHKLLVEFNDTAIPYVPHSSLHRWFEAQAAHSSDTIAIVDANGKYTYRELNELSNRFANYLLTNYNVQPNEVVALLMDRSHITVAAIIGVLKSGAAYLPMNTDAPAQRINQMLEDSGTRLLIASNYKLISEQIAEACTVVSVLEDWIKIQSSNPGNPQSDDDSSRLAYLLYTSGSTGKPKGVEITHRAVMNFMKSMEPVVSMHHGQLWMAVSNYTFDISVFELLFPLLQGASVVILDSLETMDIDLFKEKMEVHKPAVIQATPTFWSALIESGWKGDKRLTALCGGEKISQELSARLQHLTGIVWNMYGPTETTIWSTAQRLQTSGDTVTIGKPIGNTQIYIVDAALQLVPIGVDGEILISGEGLARGYKNLPELTLKKFIKNPYIRDRAYATGDKGRWLDSGEIEFVGRTDDQVKIRGYRIELGEVENALERHTDVKHAVVLENNKLLIAYVISPSNLNTTLLNTFLAKNLPAYMLPSAYVLLEKFPVTSSGKVDRKALRKMDNDVLANSAEYIAPRNAIEGAMAVIWKDVLDKDQVGINDHFFEIGGHSLKAMQVLNRVHKEMNYKVALKHLFTNPTIAKLCLLLQHAEQRIYEEILPMPEQEYYEVSHGQKRLWALDQYMENKSAYNMPTTFELEGALNVDALEKAFETLLARHEILRTIFVKVHGDIKQKIATLAEHRCKLEYIDLRDQVFKERESIAKDTVHKYAGKIFDLAKGPLIQVAIIHLQDNRYLFTLNMHHIISDGWSIQVLVNEMLILYDTYLQGKENPLSPLRIQYKDYAAWLNRQIDDLAIEKHKAYWINRFSGQIPELELLTDSERPLFNTYKGGTVQTFMDKSLTADIHQLSRSLDASLFMTLVALLKIMLNRYSGSEDIVIGTPITGRPQTELEDQIGLYINTLPLRTRFSNRESFPEVLLKVKETILEAYEHQIYPFDKLVEDLNIKRDFSKSPLFDVMINLQNASGKPTYHSSSSLKVSNYDVNITRSKYDLLFTFAEINDILSLTIEYNSDIFNHRSILMMEKNFMHLIRAIIHHRESKISDLELVFSEEEEVESSEFLQKLSSDY